MASNQDEGVKALVKKLDKDSPTLDEILSDLVI